MDTINEEIDRLLDKADLEHDQQQKLLERIEHPVTRSYKEFMDDRGEIIDKSPFYVIVHANQIDNDIEVDEQTRARLKAELKIIEDNFDHTTAGPFRLADGVPHNRPILVAGAYDAICVGQQHDLLIKAGYDTYVSKEGTLSFTDSPNVVNAA
jgi:hypothetical protein